MQNNNPACGCSSPHPTPEKPAFAQFRKDVFFDRLAVFYKILGDATRCKIIYLLLQGELCVGAIANSLQLSKSLVSHQLRKMKEQSVVKSRRSGKEVYYSLDDEHVEKVFALALEHIAHRMEENI